MKKVLVVAAFLTGVVVVASAMLTPPQEVYAVPPGQAPTPTPTPLPPPTPIPYAPEVGDYRFRREETSAEMRARELCESPLRGDRVQTAWRTLNCHVSRVTQGILMVSGGVLALTLAWAFIVLMMESTDEKLKGQSKVMVFGSLTGFAIAAMAYLLAEIFEGLIRPFVA